MAGKLLNHTYACILAGGEGTRFHPVSTPEKPKQFLNFIGNKSFIRQTFERVVTLVGPENVIITTNERYVDLVREQIPEIAAENIIPETHKKNTAPALAYCANFIKGKDPQGLMICLPSDHFISDEEGFKRYLVKAVSLAGDGYLVTLGMRTTWPSTDYGYICPADRDAEWSQVRQFTEKPKADVAEQYMRKGYLWNGGIFVWKVSTFLGEIKKYVPELCPSALSPMPYTYFSSVPSISIDYALMEKSKRVAVIPTEVGWNDIGTWEGLYNLSTKLGVKLNPDVASVMNASLGLVLPDVRQSLPRRVEKPWGYEEIWAHTGDYAGKILRINKPHRLSYQYHRIKEETIRILEGLMDLELEVGGKRDIVRLKVGDTYHIPPRTNHRMTAIENCSVLEVSTPYLEDVVRIEDDYGRIPSAM